MLFLYLFALVISLLIAILVIRFLWIVPNELRDLKHYLRKIYLDNDSKNT